MVLSVCPSTCTQVGALDAQLFMIKHLLFLREHITPFNVQFAVTDFDLDFSHMRDHMRNILAGQTSLFSMGNNAVMKMLGTGGPRVLTYQVRPGGFLSQGGPCQLGLTREHTTCSVCCAALVDSEACPSLKRAPV